MSGQVVACTRCGAPMTPRADGRTYDCAYCGAEAQVAIAAAQVAAGLALDLANTDVFLARLAQALEGGFAEFTRIQRHGDQLVVLELTLDPHLFVAKRERHGLVTQYKKLVRGVALKTVKHPLDKWFALLTEAIAEHANTNARAAQVLSQLRGRP